MVFWFEGLASLANWPLVFCDTLHRRVMQLIYILQKIFTYCFEFAEIFAIYSCNSHWWVKLYGAVNVHVDTKESNPLFRCVITPKY
jgi:hypothetical protein